jgi:Domain of unknown function (DUF4918)
MRTFAQKVIAFNQKLAYSGQLPPGISVLNPFRDNPEILQTAAAFYTRFYNDHHQRHLILGINPGRLGAGATGVPFTDTKRLREVCGIAVNSVSTHEPSSVFIYDMIAAYGGPERFYSRFYINSVCPLGFTATNAAGKEVNYNYYDSPSLQQAVLPFIEWNIETQIKMGCHTGVCFCLGTGKNYKFLSALNERKGYFERLVALEHPRYIIQYKLKEKERYIATYLQQFEGLL